ncbi:bifunctional phosphopantothenoylcysteine decarboxylase/phosphopantothenate--cysteine ligase CoaBC [archaeon]|jgi:phosphopantothenoylcysteine decarboxylase / phosphopantothenate---cysteine ligase|nr:bifunctional phosphopantothenoylcysteine decarboxylase/phosphopantothenate--cysteine ligase CoaBC [archaeon]MBT3450589.1 bifunctional phosphopantothenoylcysteine decarboxylase/phosphopantothenate--cysteine ligase CoaBC [archaeon]MBT6868443.1 bifunctional phosphopantothenoylcysteine decarboxylase/phosphopantothenate--cysteine ligase CoaBC [archaeon]MBT7193542.1 bifunctional phosphopantothenoylcysteine decarboxylase/phosphopantothenate--cysteine ligase CoaBC [archaeon]MBT7381263.1 bifunctional
MSQTDKEKSNEDLKVDIIGDYLKDKSIALCISGGIAAIETPKLARRLRRYGANVKTYMTKESQKFIGPAALEWATEQEVVTELSGRSEHICMEDLVLVAPATTNTINKMFQGIADNTITTLIASALGMQKPVYIAPTMHESLYNNPFFQRNLRSLEPGNKFGDCKIKLIQPRVGEGKAKMPRLDTIVAEVSRELSEHPIKEKQLLITGGATPVWIDDVRLITNRFSGSLSKRIAMEAYLRGAHVKLLIAKNGVMVPEYINQLRHNDLDEYVNNVFKELNSDKKYDAGIFSAAVADYQPIKKREGKIPSKGALTNIELIETIKVIKKVREEFPILPMVTFKYEDGVSVERLLEIAKSRTENYQLVIANRAQDMKTNHEAYFVTNDHVNKVHSSQEIASNLINYLGCVL